MTFTVGGSPSSLELLAIPDVDYEIRWADEIPAILDGWQAITSGTTAQDAAVLELPEREGGVWLLWLTGLPEISDGEYRGIVYEVTFFASQ